MAPAKPRISRCLRLSLSSGIRGLSQAVVIYICAALMGVNLDLDPRCIILVILFVALGAGLFSTFSLVVACIVKTRERFMGIGQVLTMPIFFASNAIYPINIMPGWLKPISLLNPLTYEVDGLRSLMLQGGESTFGLDRDFAALIIAAVLFVIIATRIYPRMTE